MKLKLATLFYFLIALLLPRLSVAEEFAYQVLYKDSPVGTCIISIDRAGTRKIVNYRMNIDVRILFVSFYKLDSQQLAVFDAKNKLIKARTMADIDGTKHAVEINSDSEFFTVVHNDQPSKVKISEVSNTTLDPVFTVPVSGKWLDLTDARVIPYEVTLSEGEISLKRPDGNDKLFSDASGVLRRIESSDVGRKGLLSMTRIEDSKSSSVTLPPLIKINPASLIN